jgi:integrase
MASIEKYRTATGEPRYNVHWRIGNRSLERSFRRARDAEAFKRHVETEPDSTTTVDPARGVVLFGEYAEAWLSERRRTDGRPLALRTRELYRSLFDRHLVAAFGARPLNKLRTEDVRRWHTKLAGDLGPLQAAQAFRLLRVILNTAVEDERITVNPCRLRGAGVERFRRTPFVDAGIVLALSDAIEERYRALVLLAGFGGLRLGELLGLQRGDIDVDANTVRIERQTVELAHGERLQTPPKTDAGTRTVHLPPSVSAALAAHLDRFCAEGNEALVFTGPLSDGLRRAALCKAWNKARRADGLDQLHLHDLRHAAATLAAQTGATTRELMSRLGHASPAAAHRYQHAAERLDVSIAESLEVLLQTVRPPMAASQIERADDVVGGNCGEEADLDGYPGGYHP